MKSRKILFISTSHDKLGDSERGTGVWLESLAAPYFIFKDAGAVIVIATPKGGQVPLDPRSQSIIVATALTKRFLKDEGAMNFLTESVLLEKINAADFDLVFLTGGHGALWDIAGNAVVRQLLGAFISQNKYIGAVSHGVAGLLALENEKGELFVKGKELTCFSNTEEESTGLAGVIPFLVESSLRLAGGAYNKGLDYSSYVIVDGNIVTGQNPASAGEVARKIIALVEHTKYRFVSDPELITSN